MLATVTFCCTAPCSVLNCVGALSILAVKASIEDSRRCQTPLVRFPLQTSLLGS